jgi:hypothetical protein
MCPSTNGNGAAQYAHRVNVQCFVMASSLGSPNAPAQVEEGSMPTRRVSRCAGHHKMGEVKNGPSEKWAK